MPGLDPFQVFIVRLNRLGFRYCITGAAAGIVYGEPRLTHDLDIILELSPDQANLLAEEFPESDFYCPPQEVLRLEAGRPQRGHFNLIHMDTGAKADVYLAGEEDLHAWALDNRQKIEAGGATMWLAPPEYVIVRKLEFYREGGGSKHLTDIAGIIKYSSGLIDDEVLKSLIVHRGLGPQWEEILRITK